MSQILVTIKTGEDGKVEATVGVALQIQATFRGGIWEAVGRRKIGKKFINAACNELVKKIGPKIQEALAQEQKYYEHPETIPAAPPEGELRGTRVVPPANRLGHGGLNPALKGSGGDAGGSDNPGVQGPDQKPDISD